MALDNRLVVYNEQGEPVDYDILASDVKFLPDGKDLPTKLAELEDEIGQGGYAPPQGGIPKTDLAESVQDSLDKADSALQDEDLADYATKTELATKQDAIVAGTGIVIGNDGKTVSVDAEVVQPSTADGTFAVRIGNNEYTINLNHEHPQYQPLLTAGSNITITTDPQTGEVTISAAGGGGGTQVQADWNQADSTAVDFIKNKPTIPVVPTAVSAFTNDAGYLTQHQSLAGRVQSQDVVSIVKISQSAYDALPVKDSTTLYLITES